MGVAMKEVTTDLDTLRENWTPKQRENWENHGLTVFKRLDALPTLLEENGADPDSVDVQAAKKWYIRTYRPKKRGEGMMERDHVQIGEPEHLFKKTLGKFGNPWGSIQGMVMASFGISEEVKEEVQDAAAAVFVARNLDNKRGLAHVLNEHEKVGELYGVN